MSWLAEHLAECTLSEAHEGYLMGRGVREETIAELGCVSWQPLGEARDDDIWRQRYGPQGIGEWLKGRVVTPIYSPRGRVLGFEARRTDQKKVSQYLLPEAKWNPVLVGLRPSVMAKIWAGGSIWIGEGQFDAFPLEWVIPETDVAVGTVRAHMSDNHVEFLRRFCRGRVFMAYDNDEQGRKATHGWVDEKTGKPRWGALRKLARVGVPAGAIPYTGKDPGQVWDTSGVEGMRRQFAYGFGRDPDTIN